MAEKKVRSFHTRRGLAQFDINQVQVPQTGVNPFFSSKYSTLDDLHKAIQDPLKKHGIYYTFRMCSQSESLRNILKLQIWDMVGEGDDAQEFEESCFALPDEGDMQKLGSAITYASRYLLSSAFLLSVPAYLDDDGNMTTKSLPKQKPTSVPSSNGKPVSPKVHEGTPSKSDNWFWGKDDNGNDEAITQKWASDMQKAGEASGVTFGQLWDYIFENQFMVYDKIAKKRTPIQSPESIRYISSDDKQTIMSAIQIGLTPTAQAEEQPELVEAEVSQEVGEDDIPF